MRILNRTFIISIITVVLFLARDIYKIDINEIVFYSLFATSFMILPKKNLIAYFLFIIPMSFNMGFSITSFLFLVAFIIRSRHEFSFHKVFLYVFGVLILELFSSIYGYFSLVEFFKFAVIFTLITIIIFNDRSTNSSIFNIYSFVRGTVVSLLILIMQIVLENGIYFFASSTFRLGKNIVEGSQNLDIISMNPNTVGLLSIISISLLTVLYFVENKNKSSNIILYIFFVFTGFLSLSRSFLFAFILYLVVVLLYFFISSRKSKVIFAFAIIVIFSVLIYNLLPNYLVAWVSRFTADDISSGRIDIFIKYNDILGKNIIWVFFGSGIQNVTLKTGMVLNFHNAIQQVYFAWGVIGFMFISLYFLSIYYYNKESNIKENIIIYLPIIIFLFIIQGSRLFSTYSYLLMLIPVTESLRLYRNEAVLHERNCYSKL